MNSIYLFDHTHVADAPSNWAKALLALGVSKSNLFDDNDPPDSHRAYGKGNVIFCHSNGYEDEWRRLVKSNAVQGNLIFVRSGGGQPAEVEERVHGCFWKPDDFIQDSPNEAVRQFISSLRVGVIRPDLLQPRAVPKVVLAYTVAVHFGFGEQKLKDLRGPADQSYKELHAQALSLLPSKVSLISFPEVKLPSPDTFKNQPSVQHESESIRFRAMRNLIDVLREDL